MKSNQLLKRATVGAVPASSMRNQMIIFDNNFVGTLLDIKHILIKRVLLLMYKSK